jgi:hypothetical protein
MLMKYGFIESVDYAAWRPERPRPTIVVMWQGQPKLHDAATYAQALLPDQILRVVADSEELLAVLQGWCSDHGLRVVDTNADRVLTISGCYGHYYLDMQRADTTSASP